MELSSLAHLAHLVVLIEEPPLIFRLHLAHSLAVVVVVLLLLVSSTISLI